MDVLNQTLWDNTWLQWLVALAAMLVAVSLLWAVKRLASSRLGAYAKKTETQWDDITVEIIERTRMPFLLVVGVFGGSLFLELSERLDSVLLTLLIIALLIQSGIWGVVVIMRLLERYRERAREENPAAVATIGIIGLVGKIALWSLVVLLILDNLGIDVTALVAGLGIGGIAVALALQNILGDLFSSLSIVLDKPFVVGDFLIVDDYLGSVEHVGLKTTRIRSLSGEQLVFSNSDLLNSRLRNYGQMYERRVVFNIGVTYQTPRDKLKTIPQIIRDIVEKHDQTRFDRSHFMKFGDYALQFETVYYVLTPDYNTYMNIQQSIYFGIHERFEEEGIEFSYPTQTLYVSRQPSPTEAL